MFTMKDFLILLFLILLIGGGYYLGWYDFHGLIGVILAATVGGYLAELTAKALFKEKES